MPEYNFCYNLKKQLYRKRYNERKQREKENELLFAPYGGERAYYRQRLTEFGFIKPLNVVC
jgi:hypothetical protein